MASSIASQNDPDRDGPSSPSVRRVNTDQGNKAQRLLRVDQIYSRKDRQVHFVKTAKKTSKPDRFGKTALVVRRIISKQGMLAGVEVDIKSSALRELFLQIFEGVEGLGLNKSPPTAEPELFFHARPYLISQKEEEKEKPNPDQSLINDIGTALRFVDEDFGSQTESLASLLDSREITFDLLWAIFPPREILIAPHHGLVNQPQALKLVSATYAQRDNGSKYLDVAGHIITHDGEDFGWGTIYIEINYFDGTKKITGLPVFPIKYHAELDTMRSQLIDRGRKYLSLITGAPACREYTTTSAATQTELPNGKPKISRTNLLGRVMIDPEAFRNHDGGDELLKPWVTAAYFMEPKDLTDDQLLLCAYWVNGFSFIQKTWGQFNVSALEEVVWNAEAFKKLVIDETMRRLIHSLVKSHRNDEVAFDDIVENKGKGLVGLLSGSPGVGKTLTAEAVAEVTSRPLYMISAGELGINADVVDRRLGMILEITRRWGCVLLIDEADVFLGTRGTDLARDTLVSIFLRRIEYFRGVLILTTNRSSEIDPAFQSRIHFSLHYPDLNESSRISVWRNFINSVAKTSERANVSDSDIKRLAQHPLNGRQIKNAVSCAVSLAREDNKPLTVDHIESLLNIINV